MKRLITLIALFVSSGCAMTSERERAFANTECGEALFQHAGKAEIVKMSPKERMERMVLEQMFHQPAFEDTDYNALHDQLIQDGLAILPTAVAYLDAYNPTASDCASREEARLLTAAIYLNLVDNAKIRLRADANGRSAINALERAIQRQRTSEANEPASGRNKLLMVLLDQMKGLNIKDGLIRETLERKDVRLSDEDLLGFTRFLISRDPTYPAWTNLIGSGEMSTSETGRFYDAYLKWSGHE